MVGRSAKPISYPTTPSGRWESALRRDGCPDVVGVDEVGRGCLAGPVYAAAVILRPGIPIPGLRDSKLLGPAARVQIVPKILRACRAWGLAAVAPCGIDRYNIRCASFQAMRRAIARLSIEPSYVLVDGSSIPRLHLPQTALVKGDRRCRSIAAASVLAKVARDRRMDRYHLAYPSFGFDRNRGYPTPEHLAALDRYGPTPIHRFSFAPVRRVLERSARPPLGGV